MSGGPLSQKHWTGILLLASILPFLPSVNGTPIWDDRPFIFQNPVLRDPNALSLLWTSTVPEDYWPITYSLLWALLKGFDDTTAAFHITNLLLHTGCVLFIWRISARLSLVAAPVAALWFAVHPVNVESVSWMFQIKTLLAAFFGLAALRQWLVAEENEQFSISAGGLFIAALLSKTSMAPLPVVMLGILLARNKISKAALVRLSPYFAVALVLGLVSVWFHRIHYPVGTAVVRDAGGLERIAAAGWAWWFYIGKAVLPINLSFVYPQWEIDPTKVWVYVPTLVAAGGLAFLARSRGARAVLWAGLYSAVMLSVVVGFVDIPFMEFSLVADHWQYLALLGPIGLFSHELARRLSPKPFLAVSLGTACLMGGASFYRAQLFDSEIAVLTDAAQKNPTSLMVRMNLGKALALNDRPKDAVHQFEAALEIEPNHPEVLTNLANLRATNKDPEGAAQLYRRVLEKTPHHVNANYNLGNLLVAINRFDEAIGHFETAVQNDPSHLDARTNLAQALAVAGRNEAAIVHYRAALSLSAQSPKIAFNLARLLSNAGQTQEAIGLFRTVLEQDPNMVLAEAGLGYALAQEGQLPAALAAYRSVLKKLPGDSEFKRNLAQEVSRIEAMTTASP